MPSITGNKTKRKTKQTVALQARVVYNTWGVLIGCQLKLTPAA